MMMGIARVSLGGMIAAASLAIPAAGHAQSSTQLLSALAACKAVTEPSVRLDCYDRAAATLQEAISRKRVVVVDREEIGKTRRSLFGLRLPSLPFLGADGEPEQIQEINSKVAAVQQAGYRKWLVRLDDGAVWRTTEPTRVGSEPLAGQSVRIRRGSFGSYLMSVGGGRGVQAVREN